VSGRHPPNGYDAEGADRALERRVEAVESRADHHTRELVRACVAAESAAARAWDNGVRLDSQRRTLEANNAMLRSLCCHLGLPVPA